MDKLDEDLNDAWSITWVKGKFDGPAEQDFNVGCIFPLRSEPTRRDVNIGEAQIAVRVFLSRISERDPNNPAPLDPAPLESLEQDIVAALQPVQGSQEFQAGYFQWQGSEFDNDLQGVECQFRAYSRSTFAIGG